MYQMAHWTQWPSRGLDDWRIELDSQRRHNFPFQQRIQTNADAHSASCPLGTGDCFVRGRAAICCHKLKTRVIPSNNQSSPHTLSRYEIGGAVLSYPAVGVFLLEVLNFRSRNHSIKSNVKVQYIKKARKVIWRSEIPHITNRFSKLSTWTPSCCHCDSLV